MTYTISVYHNGEYHPRYHGLLRFDVERAIQQLEREGWDKDLSIDIEEDDREFEEVPITIEHWDTEITLQPRHLTGETILLRIGEGPWVDTGERSVSEVDERIAATGAWTREATA